MFQTCRWTKDIDIIQNLYQPGSHQEVEGTLKIGIWEKEGKYMGYL